MRRVHGYYAGCPRCWWVGEIGRTTEEGAEVGYHRPENEDGTKVGTEKCSGVGEFVPGEEVTTVRL